MARNYEKLSEAYYDKIAARFDWSIDGLLSYPFKRLINHELHLQHGQQLLDVGCANGRLLALLNRQAKIQATGLDISAQMIALAKKRLPRGRFVCASAERLPFADGEFDYVICSASFHHFPDPDLFLQEAKRCLEKQGRLIIAEVNIPIFHDFYNRHVAATSEDGDVKAYRPSELSVLFQRNGWQIQKRRLIFQIQYYELSL
ncbi:class I SAM-dependent methyltransferase [Oenococcus kitaharae]|nr:methyltransferase domain-containing protein [Oenococcus kitaharae]OEY81648.1 SAM-dependent methyltransferase [Oenococcus kitaharae]OEY83133.1 SAM-dependent methyltransferase [Oenococcus kitaharae]OEY84321.1 SAM-dependent methyltransferase [Oenococcus kitaharae]